MKTAKSYKILFLVVALFMAVALSFGMMSFTKAYAATASNPLDYVTCTEGDVNFVFDENSLVANMGESGAFEFDNKLVIDDFKIELSATEGLKKFTVDFVYDSYFVNGNKNTDGGFDKEIVNSFEIENNGSPIELTVKVENNQIVINNGSGDIVKSENYYRIRTAGLPFATIGFTATEVEDATNAKLSIVSVDQKASDLEGKYKQTFEVDDNDVLTDKNTYPRVTLNESYYRGNSIVGYSIVKRANYGLNESLTLTPHTVLGNVSSANVWLSDNGVENSNITFANSEKPKSFKADPTAIGSTVNLFVTGEIAGETKDCFDKFEISVVNGDDEVGAVEENAPEYVDATNVEAYEAFKAALNKAIRTEDDSSYIIVGSELELPSMQDLVYDDQSSYAELKDNVTVYYNGSTSSELAFKLNNPGKYLFYVVFADEAGNKMDVKDIYDTEIEDASPIKKAYLVFEFNIVNDAPIEVNSFEGVGLGYKGVSYTAPSFKIDASGCTTTYTLYYNASKTAEIPADGDELTVENGWIAIPKASSVTDKSYNKDGYNYNAIKSIGYDGSLTFTPNKLGTYLIECTATSETALRSDTGYSIVRIESAPAVVKVPSTWLQDNVWSVVFLSIGTLCLVGIIVLLCIKPKEEKEEE